MENLSSEIGSIGVQVMGSEPTKEPRLLCVYKTESGEHHEYMTASTALELKKKIAGIPSDRIVQLWKGKPKSVKTKTVIDF